MKRRRTNIKHFGVPGGRAIFRRIGFVVERAAAHEADRIPHRFTLKAAADRICLDAPFLWRCLCRRFRIIRPDGRTQIWIA